MIALYILLTLIGLTVGLSALSELIAPLLIALFIILGLVIVYTIVTLAIGLLGTTGSIVIGIALVISLAGKMLA